jgi:5'-nucleotidase
MRNIIIYLKTLLLIFMMGSGISLFSQDLVILHTNDVHSNIEPLTSGRNAGFAGFQRRANYIKSIRENYPNVLLVDAGDYNQGTPYYTMFKGKMEIMLYNAMGYEAVCLGNHEFDDGQQLLAERLKEADYVTLCANYDFSKSPLKEIVKPYTIIVKGGKKIGLIGVTLDLKGYVPEKARAGIEYKNPIPIVNKLAKRLKDKERCDLVIVLSHLGYDGGTKERPSDLDLASESRYVDIIIGGHSHTFLEEPAIVKNSSGKGVIVNQTGALGVYVGRIDINF